jgi:hypothetical protein|tara:strand:- start:270 stop:740 length:471 start_codon:yes stop_codon:yes gene_type:complete
MVRFNLWSWGNSLRVWKAAITKKGLSYSNKKVNAAISYLEIEVEDSLITACEEKDIRPRKDLNFREIDDRINGIIFQHLKDFYDGGVADFQTYLFDIFFYHFGQMESDLAQDEFSHFKQLFDDMPSEFKKGIQLAKTSKNKKKLLLAEFLKSRYLN